MMVYRRSEDNLLRAVTVSAALVFLGALVYQLAVPMPRLTISARADLAREHEIDEEKAVDNAQIKEYRAQIASGLWKESPQRVSSILLAQFTQDIRTYRLTMTGFRPERRQPLTTIEEVPFVLEVTGPYPKVKVFSQELDSPKRKTVLKSVEISSLDTKSNTVTATFGVSVYVVAATDTENMAAQ